MTTRALAFAIAFVVPTLAASADSPTKLGAADVAIIAHVHHVNELEIDLGKFAQKAGTAPVKRYGETLVRDHTAADKDLVALAKKHGLAKIPGDVAKTDSERAELKQMMSDVAAMKKLKGNDFDRAYLKMMVDGHDGELAKTDPAIAIAGDPEVKTMLEDRKATLTRHADAARELQKGNAQAAN